MFFKRKKEVITINSYIDGRIINLEEIPDKVFSTKVMGDGFAMIAKDNALKLPAKGVISFIAQTNHAIGIKLQNNVQILIHIGLDSATTKKENFKLKVKQGQEVNMGENLVEIDNKLLENTLYIPLVIIENPNTVKYHLSNLHQEGNSGIKVINFD